MVRRPPRSTQSRSSAASDVYKRQRVDAGVRTADFTVHNVQVDVGLGVDEISTSEGVAVSYTHLRAHETVLDLVCRLLLEKKK